MSDLRLVASALLTCSGVVGSSITVSDRPCLPCTHAVNCDSGGWTRPLVIVCVVQHIGPSTSVSRYGAHAFSGAYVVCLLLPRHSLST